MVLGVTLAALSSVASAAGIQDAGPAAEVEALIQRAAAAEPAERAGIVAEIRELAELFAESAADRPEDALAASKSFDFLAGEALRDTGDAELALAMAQRAFELDPSMPPLVREFRLTRTACQVAGLHWQHGRNERAVGILRELLGDPVKEPGARVYALASLADFERLLADWDESERHALEAWQMLERIEIDGRAAGQRAEWAPYLSLQRAVAGVLARLNYELGLFDVAAEWSTRHKQLVALAGDESSHLDAILLRGTSLLYSGRVERAASELRAALEDVSLGDPYGRGRVGLVLSDALVELVAASHAQAEVFAKEARVLLAQALELPGLSNADRMEAHLTQARLALAMGDVEGAGSHLDAAEELARGSGDVGVLDNRSRPYVVALRARSARLAAGGVPDDPDRRIELDRAFEDLLEQWRNVPQRPGGVGLLHFVNKRAVLSELLTWTLGNEPREPEIDRCVRLIARAQACGSLSARLDAQEVGLTELRSELLGPRDGLLVLVPEKERTHAFLIGRELARHLYLTAPRAVLIEDSLELSEAISDPEAAQQGSTRWQASAGRLAELLFPAELRALLEDLDGLAVVGADLVGDPALEVLPLAGVGTLGTRWALSSLPSLPAGVALARRAAQRSRSSDLDLWLLAATGQVSEAGLPPIPFDEAARERLLAPFPPARRWVGAGSLATRARLADEHFTEAAIGCILGHGVRDPGRERPTGLQLAPDTTVKGDTGALWSDDVDSLAAPGACPRLVVLATCSAARGARRAGDDGLGHLGGAFLARGAQVVLIARRDVELAATLAMLEVLNERLAAGDTVQESLRRARAALVDNPRTAHPFYSGAFQLVGFGQHAVLKAAR